MPPTAPPDGPQAPRPQALLVLRSLTDVVEHATTVASAVVGDMSVLNELPQPLAEGLRQLCDTVFDLDHRSTGLAGGVKTRANPDGTESIF